MENKLYSIMSLSAIVLLIGAGCLPQKKVSTPDPAPFFTETATPETPVNKLPANYMEEVEYPLPPTPTTSTHAEVAPATESPESTPSSKPTTAPILVNCESDTDCMQKNIQSCTPATGTFEVLVVMGVTVIDSGNNCVIRHTISGLANEYKTLNGTHYDCTFTKSALASNFSLYEDYAYMSTYSFEKQKKYCSGPYIDGFEKLYQASQKMDPQEEFVFDKYINDGTTTMTTAAIFTAEFEGGKVLTLESIDSTSATIRVNSVSSTLKAGETKTIDGITVTVVNIFPSSCKINGIPAQGKDCGLVESQWYSATLKF